MKRRTVLWCVCLLCALTLSTEAAAQTTEIQSGLALNERVLVVYNQNDQESLDVANHYLARRNIPAQNLCAIAPSSPWWLEWDEFNTAIKTPVSDCLDSLGRDNILYIVFSYNTPFVVYEAPPSISVNYPTRAANNGDRTGIYWGGGGGWSDATDNAYPDWIRVTFDETKAIDEIAVITLQDDLENPIEPTPTTTFSRFGITDFDVQYWNGSDWVTVLGGSVTGNEQVLRTFTFPEIVTDRIRVVVHNALDGHSRIVEIEAYQGEGPERINVARRSRGATTVASSVLQTPSESGISLDQRVTDLWDETLVDFAINPYYAADRSQALIYTPFVSLAAYRDSSGRVIYSTWRLDASSAELAKGLVDKAILAETSGLFGRGCFDRKRTLGYVLSDSGYLSGDWDIYRAAEFAREIGFSVIEDQNDEEFGTPPAPLRCDEAALYAGWYSLNHYNDAFSWNAGAIGFHIDSLSAANPRGGTNWAANAIQRGITVTSGAVDEPYLNGVAHADGVFRNLFQGANVGDALLRNTQWVKWNILNLGDPLYRPFPQSPFPPPPSPLPNPWTSQDIGQVAIEGEANQYGGNIAVRGTGSIDGALDSFHYAYQPLNGDGEIVARLTRVEYTAYGSFAGLMVRENLSADSPHVTAVAYHTSEVGVLRREYRGGETTLEHWGSPPECATAPCWLKLTRRGHTFSAYSSADGESWTLMTSTDVEMASNAYVGLMVVSLNGALSHKAFFEQVTVTAGN